MYYTKFLSENQALSEKISITRCSKTTDELGAASLRSAATKKAIEMNL